MAESQIELESKTTDLTVEAFNAFAEDISTMFDTHVSAQQSDINTGTIADLKGKYKKLAAVCSVTAEGAVNGEFHVVFDRDGVFTLPGTFVMQPEQVIVQNRKSGSEAEANEIGDALGEVGNLMVGAWDRVFREEMEEHKHFVQSGTFIGDPWANPQDKIRLSEEEELTIITFEMTVDPLPPFSCSILYPKSIFEPPAEEVIPEEAATDETPAEGSSDEATDEVAEEAAEESVLTEETIEQADEEQHGPEENAQEVQLQEEPEKPVSEAIDRIKRSPAVLPGQFTDKGGIMTGLTAGDIMRRDVIWAGAEDSVEELIAKMQQHDTGYLLVGEEEKLKGIVSKSDIRGALSPYLQFMFAKWRSSMDVATLQIKAKWVMSCPVRTVRPDATLKVVMQTMSEHGGRCMPVVDNQGNVQGIVTVFDVFYALLNCGTEAGSAGKTVEAPPLV